MKNKLFFKILIFTISLIMIFSNMALAVENIYNEYTNNINELSTEETVSTNAINVEYDYNKSTNQVTAKIISTVKLKDTKPTWTLSKDQYTYTKIFTDNQNYETSVEDINGKITIVKIEITQIKKLKTDVKYEYNKSKTQATVKIVSNIELKDTKPTWTLSQDKLTYTKVFSSNTKYNTGIEDIYGNKLNVQINVNEIGKAKANITIKKEYIANTNQVVVKMISDVELKDTKPTWTLSQDKLTYSKIFSDNTNYSTSVQDINGNVINVNINVSEVKIAKITTNYIYDDNTNKVTAQIISDIKLKDTKPTWELSSDKYIYSKVFDSNTKYQTGVEDIFGRKYIANISVNLIDEIPPQITVEYKYNKDDTVTVYMKSNEKLKDTKPTWKLSNDKLVYEKTFNSNQNYITYVEDLHGLSASVKIDFKIKKFTYKQSDNSTIKVRYLYIEHKKAEVEIISSIELKDTKPTWKLSDDGYTYSKNFYSNNIYGTSITDINGKTKNVNIIVNLFDNYLTGIDVSAHQGKINWAEVKSSGIDFVILRCGYGQDIPSQDDAFFARNVAECERLGIPYGIYLYSYALTEKDAVSEAEHALRLIKGYNPTFGVWIDMEDADGYKERNGMSSNETLVNICTIFSDKLIENGYNTGIYASLDWLNTKLNSTKLDKYDKWVAHWNDFCGYDKVYKMWQYSSTGIVNGILTDVDMNVYYNYDN